jgi:hypothetical protein
MSDPSPPVYSPANPPHNPVPVLITRRRWDWYFLAGFAAAAPITILAVAITGSWRPLVGLVGFLLIWLMVRLLTPRHGMRAPPLSAEPEAMAMLRIGPMTVALMIVMCALDYWLTGHHPSEPLEPYHALLIGPIAIIYFARILTLARRADRRKKEEKRRALEAVGGSQPVG